VFVEDARRHPASYVQILSRDGRQSYSFPQRKCYNGIVFCNDGLVGLTHVTYPETSRRLHFFR
jgi:hypothetical protein